MTLLSRQRDLTQYTHICVDDYVNTDLDIQDARLFVSVSYVFQFQELV